jgi:DNA-binding response OmpR family regulator
MMPGIDGFEVIRRLRANPETADIQIIILSALNSQEDVVKGFNLGANDFIMKPIIMEKLLSCVVTQMQLVQARRKA